MNKVVIKKLNNSKSTLPVYFYKLTEVKRTEKTVYFITTTPSLKHQTNEHHITNFYKYISLINDE
jgi:hypothetical protein